MYVRRIQGLGGFEDTLEQTGIDLLALAHQEILSALHNPTLIPSVAELLMKTTGLTMNEQDAMTAAIKLLDLAFQNSQFVALTSGLMSRIVAGASTFSSADWLDRVSAVFNAAYETPDVGQAYLVLFASETTQIHMPPPPAVLPTTPVLIPITPAPQPTPEPVPSAAPSILYPTPASVSAPQQAAHVLSRTDGPSVSLLPIGGPSGIPSPSIAPGETSFLSGSWMGVPIWMLVAGAGVLVLLMTGRGR